MKKRLLSALLALALVFVLLPTTALAGVTTESNYDISIDGKRYKFDSDGSGGYTTAYYQENNGKTPTSNYEDVWQTNPYLEITRVDNIITITVKIGSKGPGKSVTIGASTQDINYECIAVNGAIDLIITGDTGTSLTLNKTYCGAALSATKGNITITDGVKVTASFKNKAVGNYVFYAIWAKNLTVSGANTEVTASGNCEDAIHVSGTVTVSKGAKLTATNDHNDRYKPYPITKSSAINSNVLTIADENSCVIAQAIDSLYGKPLRIQNYNIAGAIVKAGSSNYYSTETTIDKIDGNIYVKISIPALEKDSYVSIAGDPAVVGVETSIPSANGSGTYFYDQASKTLTLEDATISSGTNAIQFKAAGTYTVNLEGTNTISNVSRGILAKSANQNITGNINVILSGSGSLDISAKGRAIEVPSGNLTFNNTGAITLATTNTAVGDMNAIKVSGEISIGNDFNRNLKITAGNDTFDLKYSDFNDLNKYKSISFATPNSTISYGGTTLKQGETIKDGKGGTATVDRENNTITLDNFKGDNLLVFNAEFTPNSITLIGDSTLSAVETKYQDLTISVSGSGSLTVGSIRVPNNTTTSNSPSLTIDGAKVTAGTPTSTTRAVEVKGDLTVTNGSLTATSKSDSVPTVQVGGNASFTGSTVTITNNSTTQGERYKDSYEVSSALHVNGAITISGGTVMAEAKAGGDAIRAVGNITVSNDATVTAKNNSQYFNAITAGSATGGEVNTLYNLIVSGENTRITATNAHDNKLAYGGAINAYIENANEGHYLKANTDSKAIAPNDSTTVKSNDLTITRGDEVTPVVIAGTPLRNDTYYTITNGSTVVANGSKDNYNAFYESATKTLKLNNAQISHSFAYEDGGGQDGAIIFTKFENYFIELSGENTISSTNTYAINCHRPDRTLTIKNAAEAENAKLTLTSNWMVICSIGGLNIQSDVTMVNTKEAGYLMYVNDTFSFDGYNAYASVNASGSPLVEYTVPTSGDKDAGYQYLRITKETLETGGGSTHQHTYDQSAWKSDATHHWQECTDPNCPDPTKGITNKAPHSFSNGTCTICGYRGQTEEHHFSTDWTYDETHHWHACTDDGCTAIKDKAPHEWTGWRIDEPSPGMHNRFCNCGYNDYSHHYNLVYAAAGEAGHYQYCTLGNCTFKTSTVPHNYDGDTCTICNYTKSGEIVPPTPDNPGTIVIIRPAEEEKPAQQPNPSTGANDLVGLAVAAAVAAALGSAALGSAALLRKHD